MFGSKKTRPRPTTHTAVATPVHSGLVSRLSVPDWLWDWPGQLGDDIVTDLLALHEKVITTAAACEHDPDQQALYFEAASEIQRLTQLNTRRILHTLKPDLRPETQAAVTEILRVLRFKVPVPDTHLSRSGRAVAQLKMASKWSDHLELRITAADSARRKQVSTSATLAESIR